MAESTHSELIQDQFTRQAGLFNAAGTITNEQALKMIMEAGQTGSNDTVLDVACGGGIVVCAFAPHVRHATGIDMTPAMLAISRTAAGSAGLDTNLAPTMTIGTGFFGRSSLGENLELRRQLGRHGRTAAA